MKILIIVVGLFISFAAGAQDSLSYYLSLAAKNNPVVLQKYYEYQAALQKVPQAGGLPDPELSMGIFLSPMELVSGNQVADLRLMQMFPWFGTLRAARDEMSLMANARYESFRDAKLQVLYELQSTWHDLHKVRQNIILSEKNIDILNTIERLALVKFRTASMNNGSSSSVSGSSLADLYRIQIEMGELENNASLLKNKQNTLLAQFNGYLDRPVLTPVSLPDTLIADTLGIPLLAFSDSMLTHNPMLSMLKYEQQSLDAKRRMVTKMGYPMIGLGLNYSVIHKNEMSTSAMNGTDMVMPMVTMTLPIYRKKYKAMQIETDLLKAATAQNYTASANGLKTEYYQAVQLYQDAQRRIDLYGSQSLLAGKSLNIMMRSFAVSGSGLTDILRVLQQTLDYDYKRVEAVADLNTAIAWLKKLGSLEAVAGSNPSSDP
ncbi:MAG: TolC family protein [Bacteroidales bacterium]|nr:TolC family protein [Bacteroidales bacterium]